MTTDNDLDAVLLWRFNSANLLILNAGLSNLVGELSFMSELDAQIPTTFGMLELLVFLMSVFLIN